MRRALVLAPLVLLLAGCGGLDEESSCADWLEASPDAQREFVGERMHKRRVDRDDARLIASGTCRFAVRTRSTRVTADAAVRNAVRALEAGVGVQG